jgi:YgiT-type zinc finger domain-containing protein
MLGSHSRWLRMLGHDVFYDIKLDDSKILELAQKEKRILLTKDFELYLRATGIGIEAFYVEGKTESDRLSELAKRYNLNLEIDMNKSHCPVCNTPLLKVSKEQLLYKLEKNTLTYYDDFWKCPNCGKVYWQGAHWKQINNTLNQAKEKIKKLRKEN